jgi:hypothetical protein
MSEAIPGGRGEIAGRDGVKLRISDFGMRIWKGIEQGARSRWPKVEEINSSFFRYALCALRSAVNRDKE